MPYATTSLRCDSNGLFGTGGSRLAAFVSVTLAILLLFATSPIHNDAYWSDSATFALNGELIRDYLSSGFSKAPMAYANVWFRHYPALTISAYPPVFPVVEAAMFALFGFSNAIAQATVTAFCGVAACGAYRLARTCMAPLASAAFILMFFATPCVLLWSRRVMMELPFLSFLLLGAAALLEYQTTAKNGKLWLALCMVLAAVYTKQSAIFAAPAFAAALLLEDGATLLRRPAVWIAAGLGLVALLPLVAFTVVYALPMLEIGMGTFPGSGGGSQGLALDYLQALPAIVGWLPFIGALGYVVLVCAKGWRDVFERRLAVLMFCWFVCGFAFLSLTAHFEERYGIILTVPSAAFCVMFVVRLAPQTLSGGLAFVGALALFGFSLPAYPIPKVKGYSDAAAYLINHAHSGDVVLLDIDNTANFSFGLRESDNRQKLYVLRAEKIFVNYLFGGNTIKFDRGFSTQQIKSVINRYGVSYVVLQEPGLWINEPSMARLEAFVRNSGEFQEIASLPIDSVIKSKRVKIDIFVNKNPAQVSPAAIREMESHR